MNWPTWRPIDILDFENTDDILLTSNLHFLYIDYSTGFVLYCCNLMLVICYVYV